jgi:phosphoadenosine phosphosulfate reductase
MTPERDRAVTLEQRVTHARRVLTAVEKNHSPAAFASSLGAEDMVVLDLIARDGLGIETFTLDTGRLPPETHALIEAVRAHYGIAIKRYAPWPDSVAAFVEEHGLDGFYDGVAQRQACCAVRKLEPMRRALARKRAWVTGLRRAQSASRADVADIALDPVHGIWKASPLADWSEDDVWAYLRANAVPWNGLHDRGYRSIGCAPCTRAVQPGEDARAGRWWWEREGAAKACALDAIPVRALEVAR